MSENCNQGLEIKRNTKLPKDPAENGTLREYKMKFKFKEENTFEQRSSEAGKIRSKYPERIPVIVEKAPNSQVADIDKRKFLVPSDISVAQFVWIIRKRVQMPSERALFLFVGKVLPQTSASMGQIYEEHKDDDGFLYVAYSGESTFGN